MLINFKFVKPLSKDSGLITHLSKAFIPIEANTYTAALLSDETILIYFDNILIGRGNESHFEKLIENGTIRFFK